MYYYAKILMACKFNAKSMQKMYFFSNYDNFTKKQEFLSASEKTSIPFFHAKYFSKQLNTNRGIVGNSGVWVHFYTNLSVLFSLTWL